MEDEVLDGLQVHGLRRLSYEEHAAVHFAALPTKLVRLATERLDLSDPVTAGHIQRLLRAEQELERTLGALAQELTSAGVAPDDIEADLEARAGALRDLQSAVLLAVAND
jgi:hypothetical protein